MEKPARIPNHQDDIMALEVFRTVDGSYKNIALAKNMDINGSEEFARAIIRLISKNMKDGIGHKSVAKLNT